MLDKTLAFGLLLALVVGGAVVFGLAYAMSIESPRGSGCTVDDWGRQSYTREDGSKYTANTSVRYCQIEEVPLGGN